MSTAARPRPGGSPRPSTTSNSPTEPPPAAVDWIALVFVCASALLAGALEVFFLAEFYAGKTIIPVVVLAALAGNILLPAWGSRLVGRALGAIVPAVLWLVAVLGLALVTRPEGDLFVIDAYEQQGAFYVLLLVGALAGFVTIVVTAGRIPARRPSK